MCGKDLVACNKRLSSITRRTFVQVSFLPSKIFSGLAVDSCWQHTKQMHLKKRLQCNT
jgi:hypothetical protein